MYLVADLLFLCISPLCFVANVISLPHIWYAVNLERVKQMSTRCLPLCNASNNSNKQPNNFPLFKTRQATKQFTTHLRVISLFSQGSSCNKGDIVVQKNICSAVLTGCCVAHSPSHLIFYMNTQIKHESIPPCFNRHEHAMLCLAGR